MPRRSSRTRSARNAILAAAVTFVGVAWPTSAAPLRIGFDAVLPPIAYVDGRGEPAGFAADYVRAVAQEAGLDFEFVTGRKEDLQADFTARKIDVIAALVYSDERAKIVDFSLPELSLQAAVFQRRGAPALRTVADLRGRRVAVSRGNVTHAYLLGHPEWGLELVPVLSTEAAMLALEHGEADAAINVDLVAQKIIRERALKDVVRTGVSLPGFAYKYYMAVHKGDSALLRQLNEAQLALRDRGEFARIYEKWIGPLEARPLTWRDMRPFAIPAAFVLAVVIVALVLQRRNVVRLARQAEALHQSEQRLNLVLESGRHALWDWDVPRNVVVRSPLIAKSLGYAPGEISDDQDGLVNLAHPDDVAGFKAWRDLMAKPGRDVYTSECRMRAKDGTWRWVETTGRVLARSADGCALRAVGTHTDITERKHAELERATLQRRMLESQKLEGLGLLAGGIAHDFNNLLTAILGNASLALMERNVPPEVTQAMRETVDAARRAAELCRQMLAYAGGRSLAVEPIDLNTLISDLTVLLRHSVRKDARVDLRLADALPLVEADASQLRQVIMNLVINASEALKPEGGTIRITTSPCRPSADDLAHVVHSGELPPGDVVCLAVTDDGTGMTPETRQKIFDPFFTTKVTGRGLGLAAVLGIVRSHQGMFCVDTEAGRGTTFTLFLPATQRAARAPTEARRTPPPAANSRGAILVADDEPAVRQMAAKVFRTSGFRVVEVSDGREAVEQVRAQAVPFAAALVDLTMPNMDGVAALAAIRKLQPKLRAVLMSGFGTEDVLKRLPAGERTSILQKPFSQEELLARFTELLSAPD